MYKLFWAETTENKESILMLTNCEDQEKAFRKTAAVVGKIIPESIEVIVESESPIILTALGRA